MSSDGEGTSRQNPFPQATGSTGLIATEAAAEQWSIHNLLKFLFLNLESAYAKVFDSLNLPICQLLGPCFMDRNSDYHLINFLRITQCQYPKTGGPGNVRGIFAWECANRSLVGKVKAEKIQEIMQFGSFL
jgi:hypothetical protein